MLRSEHTAPGPAPRSVSPGCPEASEGIRKKHSPLGSADEASLSRFLPLCSSPCRELKISHMPSCTHLRVLTPEWILPSVYLPSSLQHSGRLQGL